VMPEDGHIASRRQKGTHRETGSVLTQAQAMHMCLKRRLAAEGCRADAHQR